MTILFYTLWEIRETADRVFINNKRSAHQEILPLVEDQRGRVRRLELLTREDNHIEPLYLDLLDRTILHLAGDSGDCWSRLYR